MTMDLPFECVFINFHYAVILVVKKFIVQEIPLLG